MTLVRYLHFLLITTAFITNSNKECIMQTRNVFISFKNQLEVQFFLNRLLSLNDWMQLFAGTKQRL